MYTYRKKIELSYSATTGGFSTVNTLSLAGLGVNRIADVEIKATMYDVANAKSSIIYYRNVQVVDPAVTINYSYTLNDSSFSYAEDNTTAAYLYDITYNQGTSSIIIRAQNSTGSTLNTICVIDYKINFY
jgi:hypothetical protein